jgi:hypothetical protein
MANMLFYQYVNNQLFNAKKSQIMLTASRGIAFESAPKFHLKTAHLDIRFYYNLTRC